jgi:4'-phosphopantetheinyl transferase
MKQMNFVSMTTENTQWIEAYPSQLIDSKKVHVWKACLDVNALQLERLFGHLSADEIERAEHFKFEKDRNRFVAARGILRYLLGCYLGVEPERLQFAYAHYGKPMLAPDFSYYNLNFNLSHSGRFALYAFTRGRDVGVDLEQVRYDLDISHIAQRFFSPTEIHNLKQIHQEKRNDVFFQYWTRKEAFLKAVGQGLLFPMEQCDVSLLCSTVLSPISFVGNKVESLLWYGMDLQLDAGYTAAVVAEGNDWELSCQTILLATQGD